MSSDQTKSEVALSGRAVPPERSVSEAGSNIERLFSHYFEVFNKTGTGQPFVSPSFMATELPHHRVEFQATAFAAYVRQEIAQAKSRYAFSVVNMDETLVLLSVNACGRTHVILDQGLIEMPDTDGVEGALLFHFIEVVLLNLGHNVAFKVFAFQNSHHLLEAFFKALALTLTDLHTDRASTPFHLLNPLLNEGRNKCST